MYVNVCYMLYVSLNIYLPTTCYLLFITLCYVMLCYVDRYLTWYERYFDG